MAEEMTFYSDDSGVRVTSARLIIGKSTYAMANIASVTAAVTKPSRKGPAVLIALGLLLIAMGASSSAGVLGFGLFLIGVGVLWLIMQKATYNVRISSTSGEADALSSPRMDYIAKIVQAINEAIIKRG